MLEREASEAEAIEASISGGQFDKAGLLGQARVTDDHHEVRLICPMLRNRFLAIVLSAIAARLGYGGHALATAALAGGVFGVVMGLLAQFIVPLTLFLGGGTLYMMFNRLAVTFSRHGFTARRSLFFGAASNDDCQSS